MSSTDSSRAVLFALVAGLVGSFASGCRRPVAPLPAVASASASISASPSAPASGSALAAPAGRATHLVFVDQTHRCPCSAEKVEAAWKMLQTFIKQRPATRVDRVFTDVDAARVEALRQEEAYSGLPAIYLLDDDDRLVTLLQGDLVTRAEIDRRLR